MSISSLSWAALVLAITATAAAGAYASGLSGPVASAAPLAAPSESMTLVLLAAALMGVGRLARVRLSLQRESDS